MADAESPRLLSRLEELDALLRGTALDDALFEELAPAQLHSAHGVAGRLQDRVIAVLTRLTMEMASRDDRREGSHSDG
jgi:hypothetical protein